MSAVLINPNLIFQRNDPFTTGIVYMPISLAYSAASLLRADIPLTVIDAFAEQPRQSRTEGKFTFLGLKYDEIVKRIPGDCQVVFVYAINLTSHLSCIGIVSRIKKERPETPIVILENTQAVTAYSLKHVAKEFYDAGASYILTGEADRRIIDLYRHLSDVTSLTTLKSLDGLGSSEFYNPPIGKINDLDSLPFPAWHLFPLRNYWGMKFAHGPLSSKRYLPLLTSRGCPYVCGFCVVPETNNKKWRFRSPKNVVDEIEYFVKNHQVSEFHIEDLDPTISDDRIRGICTEIVRRNLKVKWKIVAGTKVETIKDEETIRMMAQAGCTYISISPETGSPELLKKMKKIFKIDHAKKILKAMNDNGVKSQACFVLGYPEETQEDRILTRNMVKALTRVGIDEIALFIVTPVPGSSIFEKFSGYSNLSDLNFTPVWRSDYKQLSDFRMKLYRDFLIWKCRYFPIKILKQALNFLMRRFETKMEMVPYRAIILKWVWN